jgi:hypothetical protein
MGMNGATLGGWVLGITGDAGQWCAPVGGLMYWPGESAKLSGD